jgi:uncharacterized protein YxjI
MTLNLQNNSKLIVSQRKELFEFLGFETRNKYDIKSENNELIGFCAEQNKGLFGFLFRQVLGHWRSFEIHFFDLHRNEVMKTKHPFRFFFQEFEIYDNQNQKMGRVQQRFSILKKSFDIYDIQDNLIFEMRSGFFSFWTFPFTNRMGQQSALLQKKWSGFFKELLLDADNFLITFRDSRLNENQRMLILAASVFTDIQYFEKKAD